ncbi:MAG: sialate O-acetylesterase [Planctomycetota bacterium]
MQRLIATLLALMLSAPLALAEVTLPSVFGDHMVLQRDKEVRIWGKAEPGEEVVVVMTPAGADLSQIRRADATASQQGDWQVTLPPTPSGQPWIMTIAGSKTTNVVDFEDIVFGEVWVASGQSNMSWTVAQSANAKEEIANSANDQIRMWTARRTVKTEPAFDVNGGWAVASPKTTGSFSAVAYYYARELQEELGVPVGILHASWGGTPVEAWTSRQKLDSIDWAKPILQRYDAAVKAYPQAKKQYDREFKRWEETRNGPPNTGEKAGYAKPGFDDSQWKTMKLPQTWEKAGLTTLDGVVWFRKTIELPEGWATDKLRVNLGPVDDGETTYVNGVRVGHTNASNRGAWQVNRSYAVPAEAVKDRKLVIAVRAVDLSGAGGIWGKPEQLYLVRDQNKDEPLSLADDWKYLVAHELNANTRPTRRPDALFGPDHPHAPAGLYHGMIAPIVPYTIQGAIWYQGESNASRAEQYGRLFPGMINDWRELWGQGEFPFLFVQLANYRQPTDKVVDTDWAHLRDAQLNTLRQVKNTGMAVTIDIGEANNIHPKNKQDVGKRLALWALADTYGQVGGLDDEIKSGPIYSSRMGGFGAKDGKAVFWLHNFGGELKARDGKALQGFTIAGKNGRFVKASAEIMVQTTDNEQLSELVVWSDQVKDPVAVRYAWEDNPDEANLVNEEGLPASPFRTDDFKGPTDGRR